MKKKNKFILIVLITTLVTYLLNKIIFAISTINNKLYSYNSNYYNWRFGKIFYTKQGSGQPILLIHTLDSKSSDAEWNQIIKSLKENYTVYTIDLLGCGRSDKPKLTYTSYLYVQLLQDFIKNVIGEPTNVICSGLSTSIVTMSCYQQPENYKKLLYINPTDIKLLNKYPKKFNKAIKIGYELPIIGELIYNICHSNTLLKYKFKNELFYNKKNIKNKYIKFYHEGAHINGETAKFLHASINNNYLNTNISLALQQINNSIFIISGKESQNSSEIVERYSSINASIEISYIEKSKLLPQLERPDEVIKICNIYFT